MSMWASYSSAISVALAVILLVSGTSKWRNRVTFEVVLTRLVPRTLWNIRLLDSRRLARLVCVVEIATAIALLATNGPASQITSAAVVFIFGIFLGVAITAFRRGTSCGCAGKASTSAEPLDVARAVFFTLVTVILLLSRLQEQTALWQLSGGRQALSLVAGLVMSAALLRWLYRPRPLRQGSLASFGEDDSGASRVKGLASSGMACRDGPSLSVGVRLR